MTSEQAYQELLVRLSESCKPNQIAASAGITDRIAIRQIEIGMYLAACAAFERFVHEIDKTTADPKGAYLQWAHSCCSKDYNSVYEKGNTSAI